MQASVAKKFALVASWLLFISCYLAFGCIGLPGGKGEPSAPLGIDGGEKTTNNTKDGSDSKAGPDGHNPETLDFSDIGGNPPDATSPPANARNLPDKRLPTLPNQMKSNSAETGGPPGFPQGLDALACAALTLDGKKGVFVGKLCKSDAGQDKCATSCRPASVPTQSLSIAGSWKDQCSKAEVICVGADRSYKTLNQAAAALKKDPKITRILIGPGTYSERVAFEDIPQDFTLEGVSNDRVKGTRIVAPYLPREPRPFDATLHFQRVKTVTLKRLVISGGTRGLFVQDAIAVNINQSHLTANLKTGATISKVGALSIVGSRFTENGGQWLIPTGDGSISVNINQSHRVVGSGQIAVNINQSHRTAGLVPAKTLINSYGWLRFGLLVGRTPKVTVRNSQFSRNGAGGMLIGSGQIAVNINQSHRVAGNGQIAVNINQSHRVVGSGQIAVNINQSHRVIMEGNLISNNGPVGRANYANGQYKASSCGSGSLFEGGLCHVPPLTRVPSADGGVKDALLGVGMAVYGAATVDLRGNSFFANDAMGFLVHSARQLKIEANVIERNGVRPKADLAKASPYAFPGAALWNITQKVEIQNNILASNLSDGLRVSVVDGELNSAPVELQVLGNHIAGSGRWFSKDNRNAGNGIFTYASTGTGGFKLDVRSNYFTQNRRAGFGTEGLIFGSFQGNWFQDHANRSLVIHHSNGDHEPNSDRWILNIHNNAIGDGFGYGIQIYKSTFNLSIWNNSIRHIHPINKAVQNSEADGINFFEMKGYAWVQDNSFFSTKRAGMVIRQTILDSKNNQYDDKCPEHMAYQGSKPKSYDAKEGNNNKPNFESRENF